MYLTTPGLVIRVTDYNDRDALLTLLTRQYGKLTVKARGLRRKNSPLVAACQLLTYGEFTLFEYRGQYTVNEAQATELFSSLRKDLTKLSLGTYFAQAAEVVSQEDLPNPELLSLVLNCLYCISQRNEPEQKVKAVFELRLACIAGYQPDLFGCHVCGCSSCVYFDISEGALECADCHSHTGIRLPVTDSVIEAMRYICLCDPRKLFSFQLGAENMEKLSELTEAYLCAQLERGFSALDFYKSLLI